MFRRLVVLVLICAACALPAAAAKRVALVIGNSQYQTVSALTNPANDATLMAKALKQAGFTVMLKNDLDQKSMKMAMLEFGRALKAGAEASMFFYAGHGIEIDGKNYLVPVDADLQNKEEADLQTIEVNDFLALMENSGVPLNIVVLDACRNNPFRSMRGASGGLAPVLAPSGTYVAYSTAAGRVAADGEGANSPFTEALAASMAKPGLSLEEVFKQTRTKVRTATAGAQVPFDSSAIEGNFYFTPAVEKAVAQTTDEGEAAFNAAGDDPTLLAVVAEDFSTTIWGRVARERIKSLERAAQASAPAKVAILNPEAQQGSATLIPAPKQLVPPVTQSPVATPVLPLVVLGMTIEPLTYRHHLQYKLHDKAHGLIVTKVLKGSPAFAAKIVAGDAITKVGPKAAVLPTDILEEIERERKQGSKLMLLHVIKKEMNGVERYMSIRFAK